MTAPLDTQTNPRSFGKYEILSFVGSGGMSTVYRARLMGPGQASKEVALKVIEPKLCRDRDFVLMFLDEMRLAMSMAHRNIVQTFDAGEAGGTYYLVMELVEGCSLRDLLDAAPDGLPLDIALFVGMEVCASLHYAHHYQVVSGQPVGIVHRDVTPGNILLSREGDVKLADFGVAKAAGRLVTTVGDAVKGKLAYMAPEQAQGQATARSDIFSVGAVMYEMLVGRPMRRAATLAGVSAGEEATSPLAMLRRDLSPSLLALITECLATDAADRPGKAREVRRRLQQEHMQLLQEGEHEPDPHARLQSFVATTMGDADRAGPPTTEQGNRLAQAMFERIRALPTNPGTGTSPPSQPSAPVAEAAVPPTAVLPSGGSTKMGKHTIAGLRLSLPQSALARWRWLLVVGVLLLLGMGAFWGVRQLQSGRETSVRAVSVTPVSDAAATKTRAIVETGVRGTTSHRRIVTDARRAVGTSSGTVTRRREVPRVRKSKRARARAVARRAKQRRVRAPGRLHVERTPAQLFLNSRPWTSVWIDGKYRGETPIEGLALSPGVHRVRLVNRTEGVNRSLSLKVRPGQTMRKVLDLAGK